MRVLITGCASHLARALLPRLLAEAAITQVVGVDIKKPTISDSRLEFVALDIRDPRLRELMVGVDAVIHLAFVVLEGDLRARRHDRALMREINVEGGKQVVQAAAASGVRTFIQVSSAAVYALPLAGQLARESDPRGALPGFRYAEDKVAFEAWLDDFENTQTGMRVVRLRPHVILGPHAQPVLKRLVALPFFPHLPDPQPRTQCVHEDDIAEAVWLALSKNVTGAFNLAAADALSFRDLQRALHGRALPLPFSLVKTAFTFAWHLFGWGTDPAWLGGLHHSLALDISRAQNDLGWSPRFSCVEAASAALKKNRREKRAWAR